MLLQRHSVAITSAASMVILSENEKSSPLPLESADPHAWHCRQSRHVDELEQGRQRSARSLDDADDD